MAKGITVMTPSSQPANPRGGPRTDAGKANSSRNSLTHGLFAVHDFIRPDEAAAYAELNQTLRLELAPQGLLENNLVDEIRRAMWRLRRCGLIEESFVASGEGPGDILDPMQNESQARLQLSVDRARSQSHRLLHKCTAELRNLQTERLYRAESRISVPGIGDTRAVVKQLNAANRQRERREMAELDAILDAPFPDGTPVTSSFCKQPIGRAA